MYRTFNHRRGECSEDTCCAHNLVATLDQVRIQPYLKRHKQAPKKYKNCISFIFVSICDPPIQIIFLIRSYCIHIYNVCKVDTVIKKKTKFSTYIRKSRREQLQSHIWLTAYSYMTKYCAFPRTIGSLSSYMTLQSRTAPIWISLYLREILFSFFISVIYINKI